eukprot:6664442-Prymnesium_polylepis.1
MTTQRDAQRSHRRHHHPRQRRHRHHSRRYRARVPSAAAGACGKSAVAAARRHATIQCPSARSSAFGGANARWVRATPCTPHHTPAEATKLSLATHATAVVPPPSPLSWRLRAPPGPVASDELVHEGADTCVARDACDAVPETAGRANPSPLPPLSPV